MLLFTNPAYTVHVEVRDARNAGIVAISSVSRPDPPAAAPTHCPLDSKPKNAWRNRSVCRLKYGSVEEAWKRVWTETSASSTSWSTVAAAAQHDEGSQGAARRAGTGRKGDGFSAGAERREVGTERAEATSQQIGGGPDQTSMGSG